MEAFLTSLSLQGTAWNGDFIGVNVTFTPHPVSIKCARSGGSVAAPGRISQNRNQPHEDRVEVDRDGRLAGTRTV
eukprot:3950595-Prymnesium_polylepis.1